jgi:cytochrome b subunit of formate dehydrogenase
MNNHQQKMLMGRASMTSMTDQPSETQILESSNSSNEKFTRFDLSQRIQHIVFLISFTILGLTGLAQKYSDSLLGQWLIFTLGGIETTRIIHRSSSVVMMIVSIYHVLDLFYRLYVLRVKWTMLPWIDDIKHVIQDVSYYLGLRKHKAYYGRYTYVEKMEYLAVVWGTIIMGLTGFMMWNPISTARILPGEAIPAAKAAHSGEAQLAVLAIIIWHFYHVHFRHFNKSMFNGKLSRQEMLHEHPAELAEIESGAENGPSDQHEIRQRQKIYFPVSAVILIIFGFGVYRFVAGEKTAITTIPPGETAQVFVPITPTPRPTPTPVPTLAPGAEVGADTWVGTYEALFRNRCGTCHGMTSVGGLSLATYQDALAGGNSGPGIVPGNPDQSMIIQVQSAGGHPGQLTIDEVNQVINWILAGAPEN